MSAAQILAPMPSPFQEVLTPEAIDFLVDLESRFGPRRRELLAERVARQRRLDAGESLEFLTSPARAGRRSHGGSGLRPAAAPSGP